MEAAVTARGRMRWRLHDGIGGGGDCVTATAVATA
jgi:hypothetical protein